MYFVVSWDISASNPTWSQVDERLRNCFANYESVRPVNTFYMVKVATSTQYQTIFNALSSVAQNSQVMVNFIMSPFLPVTGWDGWLHEPYWDKIRQIAA